MSRPGHSYEVRQRPQLVRVPPLQDLGDCIRAGDEEQLGVRVLPPDVPQTLLTDGSLCSRRVALCAK